MTERWDVASACAQVRFFGEPPEDLQETPIEIADDDDGDKFYKLELPVDAIKRGRFSSTWQTIKDDGQVVGYFSWDAPRGSPWVGALFSLCFSRSPPCSLVF